MNDALEALTVSLKSVREWFTSSAHIVRTAPTRPGSAVGSDGFDRSGSVPGADYRGLTDSSRIGADQRGCARQAP
jgi:hypothetical protein